MRWLTLVLLLGVARWSLADEPRPVSFAVVSDQSTVAYRLVHKLHTVTGTTHHVEGAARILPGAVQVEVRTAAASFDSGNVNRDAHMKEALEAARYPEVVLKALGPSLPVPPKFPTTATQAFRVQLTLHGVSQILDLSIELKWENPNRVRASAKFPVSLEAFHVERPSLMFVKVEDTVRIEADILFAAQP